MPTIGVSGAKRARRTNVGSTPPSLPKTKLGRRITCSTEDAVTARSISHFAAKYGTRVLRALVQAEGAREHEAAHARVLRRRDELSRVPSAITRSKSAREPLMIATRWTTASTPATAARRRGRIGDVSLDELDAPGRQARRPAAVAHERPHRDLPGAQRMHDVLPDEAGGAGDEDGHSKFFQ